MHGNMYITAALFLIVQIVRKKIQIVEFNMLEINNRQNLRLQLLQ